MKTKDNSRIQNLEFLPLILIAIYKIAIQYNSAISGQNKMYIMYAFIGVSTVIFGYLLVYRNSNFFIRIVSLSLLVLAIFLSCYLIYFKN